MGRIELPGDLVAAPFAVGRAWELGLRSNDLRRRGLHRPTHGVRSATAPANLPDRVAAFAPGLPEGSAFSHVTAAVLHGIPLPAKHERDPVLDVMAPDGVAPTRRQECRGHRGLGSRRVVVRSGVQVVSAVDTWCDLGQLTNPSLGVDDLVVAGDAVVWSLASEDPVRLLAGALDGRAAPRGARALRQALTLVRSGVRSPMESRARLMFVRAGFPEPRVNRAVRDGVSGWLLEGDLVWEEQRVVGEYQGADHRDRRRRSADAQRAGLARDEGWTVLEIWAEDVFGQARRRTLLRRFARALGLDVARLPIT